VCTFSMVIDHYAPYPEAYWTRPTIEEFRQALEQARQLDKKIGQEDCVDPEKAKMIDRIAELEKALPPVDEVEIIGEICKALSKLDPKSRGRVYAYVMDKYPE
jgi:hypothetical protein